MNISLKSTLSLMLFAQASLFAAASSSGDAPFRGTVRPGFDVAASRERIAAYAQAYFTHHGLPTDTSPALSRPVAAPSDPSSTQGHYLPTHGQRPSILKKSNRNLPLMPSLSIHYSLTEKTQKDACVFRFNTLELTELDKEKIARIADKSFKENKVPFLFFTFPRTFTEPAIKSFLYFQISPIFQKKYVKHANKTLIKCMKFYYNFSDIIVDTMTESFEELSLQEQHHSDFDTEPDESSESEFADGEELAASLDIFGFNVDKKSEPAHTCRFGTHFITIKPFIRPTVDEEGKIQLNFALRSNRLDPVEQYCLKNIINMVFSCEESAGFHSFTFVLPPGCSGENIDQHINEEIQTIIREEQPKNSRFHLKQPFIIFVKRAEDREEFEDISAVFYRRFREEVLVRDRFSEEEEAEYNQHSEVILKRCGKDYSASDDDDSWKLADDQPSEASSSMSHGL